MRNQFVVTSHCTVAASKPRLLLLRAGDLDVAEGLLRSALAADPTFAPARRTLLRVLDRRPADAIAMCREWVAAAPDFAEAKRHLAWSLLQTHEAAVHTEALALARTAAAAAGDDAPSLQVLGAAQFAAGQVVAARATLQRGLGQLDPQDRFTPYYRALMEGTLKQCDTALGPADGR